MAEPREPPHPPPARRDLLVVLPNRLNVGGGQEHDLLDLVEKLARGPFRVTVADFDTLFREQSRISDEEIARRLGDVPRVTIPCLPVVRRITPIPTLGGLRRLRKLLRSADLVISCPFYFEDAIVAVMARVAHRTLVISHDGAFLHHVRGSPAQALQDIWNRTIGVRLLRRMAGVRLLSHDEERTLNRRGIARTIVLFPTPGLGPATEGETARETPVAGSTGGSSPAEPMLRVLVAGRMTLQKGMPTVAEVLDRIRQRPEGFERFHFTFAGTRQLPPAIARFVEEFPQRVENIGFVLGLEGVLRRTDVLLMPSLYESLGMSAVAAIRGGVPVIASDIPGLREVVESGRTGWLVPPRDAAGFLRALDASLELKSTRPTEWSVLRDECRRRYESRFGLHVRERQYTQFLEWLGGLGTVPSSLPERTFRREAWESRPRVPGTRARVLIATHSSLEIDSGEERMLGDLARYLIERGDEVRVANYQGLHGNEARVNLEEVRTRLGAARLLEVPAMPVVGRILAVPSFRGLRALDGAMRWSDVVVFGQFYGFDLTMFLLGRRTHARLVASQANALTHAHRGRVRVAAQEGYARTVGVPLLRRFEAIRVCNSDDLRSLTGEGCRRVLLLYPPNTDLSNSIHPEKLEAPYREICDRLSLDRRFKLLIAGRMSYQKGVDLLCEILLRLGEENPRVAEELVFLPAGTHQLPEGLRRVASRFPGLVTNLGVLPRDALPSVMSEVDAVLMPSRYESFGRVAAEAQSLGKPVIATDITGPREVVTDGVTGILVRSWSAEAFVAAIRELCRISRSEPERWTSMKASARASFQQRFGKDRMDGQLDAFALELEELARSTTFRSS